MSQLNHNFFDHFRDKKYFYPVIAIAFLLIPVFTVAITRDQTNLFSKAATNYTAGLTTKGNRLDSGNNGGISTTQVKTGATGGVLSSVSVYIGAVNKTPKNHMQVAIYADNGSNLPSTLLAQTAAQTLTANRWNVFTMTPIVIQPNTYYWLAFNVDGANTQYAIADNSQPRSTWKIPTTYNTWPNPFGAPNYPVDNRQYSIYMTYSGTSAPLPTPLPTATPTPTVTPTSIPADASPTSSLPTPTVAPVSGDYPGPSNTGYKNAPGYPGSLTSFTGTIQSNQTYRFMDFPNGLTIPAGVSNVIFYGCRFTSNEVVKANVFNEGDNITFDYSTFAPKPNLVATPPVPYDKGYQYSIDQRVLGMLTVDHSDLWGWGNAISADDSSQTKPIVVRNSWFHDARDNYNGTGPDHTDAILSNYGTSYMVFDHNTIVSKGNTQGLALQWDDSTAEHRNRAYYNITVTNNYFSGFNATVNLGGNGHMHNSVFTDNVFGTDIQPDARLVYGDWATGTGNVWRRNKIHYVPGSKVYYIYDPKDSSAWRGPITAADDGKYWVPNDDANPMSTTDYTGN